ncbi:MAG TPA: hypothetical protein PLB25_20840 [Rhodoferax sp.]|jgi:hypothetical protein|nr:hypothetical protein [Rhodoferax sp.]
MNQILGSLGIFGILIFIFLVIILPISVYAAQKWAYKCFKELEKLNEKIDRLSPK